MASFSDTRAEVYLAAGSILEQLLKEREKEGSLSTLADIVRQSTFAAHDLVKQCKEAAAKIDAKPEVSPVESVKPAVKFSEFLASLDCVKSKIWLERIHPRPWKLDLDKDGDADTIIDVNGLPILTVNRAYPKAFLQWLCDTVNGGP